MRKLPIAFGLIALLFFVVWMLTVPKITRKSTVARIAATKSELLAAKSLLETFKKDCGRYPTTEEGLWALETSPKPLKSKWKGPYGEREVLEDPFGNGFQYRSSALGRFSLKSYGADGVEGGEGDNADLVVTS